MTEKQKCQQLERLEQTRSLTMFDDLFPPSKPFSGVGFTALTAGVICCMGLKVLGATAVFGGLAATIGFSIDVVTFLIGSVSGLVIGVGWLRYQGVSILS